MEVTHVPGRGYIPNDSGLVRSNIQGLEGCDCGFSGYGDFSLPAMPPWAWALVAAGGAGLLGLGVYMRSKRKKR